jgi:PAS domain S-box-containing protein
MSESVIRVLLIEGDAGQAKLVKEMLSSIARCRFEVRDCAGIDGAVELLKERRWDVALFDLRHSDVSPRTGVRRLREVDRAMPVVLLCGSETEALADALVEEGAHDYLAEEVLGSRTLARMLRHAADRRRNEEELRRERDLLRTLIDNLPDHIYVKDVHSGFLLNNAAHLKFLGASSQEQVLGKTDKDVFPPGVGDVFYAEEQEIIRTGEALISREERNVDAGGNEHWVTSTKVPWRDASGRILGLVGLSRDITRRKNNEQKLRDQNTRLEEALEKLKQAQSHLVQSEKLAGLGQMVAGIAHEMNNPLSFAGNNVAVAQRDLLAVCDLIRLYRQGDATLRKHQPELMDQIIRTDERIDIDYTVSSLQELMQRSREGIDRIRQIVRDLCDFARLDTSDLQDADLNDGIRAMLNIVGGAARNKGIDIEPSLERIPLVPCYPAKINQAVLNLLSNAIDACSSGGKVTVRTAAGPRYVEIVVSDNGSGIDPTIQERVFDPFFTTKPPGKGTGLGLSISYGVVRAHGGDISFASTPGHGATFTVKLPVPANALTH